MEFIYIRRMSTRNFYTYNWVINCGVINSTVLYGQKKDELYGKFHKCTCIREQVCWQKGTIDQNSPLSYCQSLILSRGRGHDRKMMNVQPEQHNESDLNKSSNV